MAEYASHAFLSKKNLNPKTILGFYATILLIVLGACLAMIGVLSGKNKLDYLVPCVLVFAGLIVIAIIIGVSWVALKDPSRLMLTEVSGTEYRAIQQDVYLGDSKSGLRRVNNRRSGEIGLAIEQPKSIEGQLEVKTEGQNG